ncbi:hypothetical protein QNI16_35705 [Cytophagaceae bacterium YF14B1]|uniref:Uncharacterized protein n=1 Tax=Xanthocytophaga flava TaxID=3048013 RepID=A0AAE3UBK8_9BACT|nr:hypothetical protein [Xanthocytophaga flavus]MDJ1485882.1 hypothetical protein [Xanthocytophaga flavus]
MLFLILTGCMANPEQPPLTTLEKAYFSQMAQQCCCSVVRSVNPRDNDIFFSKAEKSDLFSKGSYIIEMDRLHVGVLDKKDSLQKASRQIAKKLHKQVLGKAFAYSYDEITVIYTYRYNEASMSHAVFTYLNKELETNKLNQSLH